MRDKGGAVAELVREMEERELFTLLRRRRGVTQEEVARRAGVSRPRVSRWERGTIELGAGSREKLWAALDSERGRGRGEVAA